MIRRVLFVLEAHSGQVTEDSSNGNIAFALLGATQVFEPFPLVQDEVDEGEHHSHTNAVPPTADDIDNVCETIAGLLIDILIKGIGYHILVREPPKQTEASCECIHTEDSNDQRQGGPSVASTRHKDEPVFRQCDLQEQNLLD